MTTAELTLSTFTAAGPPLKIPVDSLTSSRTFEALDAQSWRESYLRDLDPATSVDNAHTTTVRLCRYIVAVYNMKSLVQVFPNLTPSLIGIIQDYQDICHRVMPPAGPQRWTKPHSHCVATIAYLLGLTYTEDIQWLGGPRLNDCLRVPAAILAEPTEHEARVRSRLGDIFAGQILLHAQHCSDRIYLIPQ